MDTCMARCSHGGVCTLDRNHQGLHDAGGYCSFTEEERLPDAVGDALYFAKSPLSYMVSEVVGGNASSDET